MKGRQEQREEGRNGEKKIALIGINLLTPEFRICLEKQEGF